MSILIKCMEIPKSCGRCWFNNSSLSCAITGSCIDRDDENRERLDDCPLVDLGKHGDLKEFIEVPEYIDDDDGTYGIKASDIFKAYMDMKFAPTVIEAEDET